MRLVVNGKEYSIGDTSPDTPLLWVLRDVLGLTGTKFGCGIAMCGACTVHIDGEPYRSCSLAVGEVEGAVTTVEAIGGEALNAVQEAWIAHQVAQCGYCQSGQIMSAVALLADNQTPSDEEIDKAMAGNLCRCGTYPRIRAAIHEAGRKIRGA